MMITKRKMKEEITTLMKKITNSIRKGEGVQNLKKRKFNVSGKTNMQKKQSII
jgi:hypothetical protein